MILQKPFQYADLGQKKLTFIINIINAKRKCNTCVENNAFLGSFDE